MVKMNKVICLNQAPLNPRSRALSYADAFIAAGFEYEFWDLTSYFKMFPTDVANKEEAPFVRTYSTIQEIEKAISEQDCSSTLFFAGIPERWEHRLFYKCLKDHGCIVLRSNPCANTIPVKSSITDKIKEVFRPGKLISYIKRRMYSIYRKRVEFEYYDVFSSSNLEYRTQPINHPDYETYVRSLNSNEEFLCDSDYAVFYDAFFPVHPDLQKIKEIRNASQERYLERMNSFFSFIEKKYNVEVIIAAHPSSQYKGDEFNGRKIIMWKTCQLTINAKLVINHLSNCTSFATLADKPIVFVTTDEIEKCSFLSRYIDSLTEFLGHKKYNLDHCDYSEIQIRKIEGSLRERYIYGTLTDKTIEHKTNAEIYIDYARSKNNKPA